MDEASLGSVRQNEVVVKAAGAESDVIVDREKGVVTKKYTGDTYAAYPNSMQWVDNIPTETARLVSNIGRLRTTTGAEFQVLFAINYRIEQEIAQRISAEAKSLEADIQREFYGALSIAREVGIRRYLKKEHQEVGNVLVRLKTVRAAVYSQTVISEIPELGVDVTDKKYQEGLKLLHKTKTKGAEIDMDIAESNTGFLSLAEADPQQALFVLQTWANFLSACAEMGIVNLDKPHAEIVKNPKPPPTIKTYDLGACRALDSDGQEKAIALLYPDFTQKITAMDMVVQKITTSIDTIREANLKAASMSVTQLPRLTYEEKDGQTKLVRQYEEQDLVGVDSAKIKNVLPFIELAVSEWQSVKAQAYDYLLPTIDEGGEDEEKSLKMLEPFSRATGLPNVLITDQSGVGYNMNAFEVQLSSLDERILVPYLTITRDVICGADRNVRGLIKKYKQLTDAIELVGPGQKFDPLNNPLWLEIRQAVGLPLHNPESNRGKLKVAEEEILATRLDKIRQQLWPTSQESPGQPAGETKTRLPEEESIENQILHREASLLFDIQDLKVLDDERDTAREAALLLRQAPDPDFPGVAIVRANLQRFYEINMQRAAMIRAGDNGTDKYRELSNASFTAEESIALHRIQQLLNLSSPIN